MAQIDPYLNFAGKTEEAFNFYKSVFGGEFKTLQRFSDTPHGANMPDNEKNAIMHVALPIGKNTLMGTDVLESQGHSLTLGNNYSIAIAPESIEEMHHIFNGLATRGTVMQPLEKMFWGAWFGMLTDEFGVQWMINYMEEQK